MQLSDYIDLAQRSSILEFWLETLAMGGVFMYSTARLGKLGEIILDNDSYLESLFNQIPDPALKQELNYTGWEQNILTSSRLNARSETELVEIFLKRYATISAQERPSDRLLEIAHQFAKQINKITGDNQKTLFKLELFGIKDPQLPVSPRKSISFLILPSWEELEADSKTELFEQIIRRLHLDLVDKTDRLNAKDIEELIGLANSASGFSNFLNQVFNDLASQGAEVINQYLDDMSVYLKYTDREREIVRARLLRLAELAKNIGQPKLANSWGDYRVDFASKMSSFYSNKLRQEEEIVTVASKHLDNLTKYQDKLVDQDPDLGIGINDLINIYQSLLDTYHADQYLDPLLTEGAQLLLPRIRRDLNAHLQANSGLGLDFKTDFRDLTKQLPRIPNLLGESAREKFIKVVNYKDNYQDLISQFTKLLSAISPIIKYQSDAYLQAKDLERLRKWAVSLRSHKSLKILALVELRLNMETLNIEDKVFYNSPFARQKRELISYQDTPASRFPIIEILEETLEEIRNPVTVIRQLDSTIDYIELIKILSSILISKVDQFEVDNVEPINKLQDIYLALRDYRLNNHSLNTFLQTMLLAELKGLLSLVSKREYIERSAIQEVNGAQIKLVFDPKDPVTSTKYYIEQHGGLMGAELKGGFDDLKQFPKPKSGSLPVAKPYKPAKNSALYRIGGSRYQKQFLWWLIKKPKYKHNPLSFMGGFSIAETRKKIRWDDQARLHIENIQGSERVFASIPFNILAKESKKGAFGLEKQQIPNRIVGVDVGEKGLAWLVIEVGDEGNVVIVDQGFIRDNQHQALSGQVTQLKKRQRFATFSSQSTHIAELRKSLASSYQARVEALALKYQARISYEFNINAFETGGNRIVKVYKSLKVGSVFGQNSADNAKLEHYWGKAAKGRTRRPGIEVSASGTSQTCGKCKRWYKYDIKDKEQYQLEILEDFSELATIDTGDNNKLLAYTGGNFGQVSGQEINKLKLIYAFMRPPIHSQAMQFAIGKNKDYHRIFSELDAKDWVNQNANSAIFVCPYLDCLHIADADLQAALNIALRGYLKLKSEYLDTKKQSDKKQWDQDTFYELIRSQLTYPSVGFDPGLR